MPYTRSSRRSGSRSRGYASRGRAGGGYRKSTSRGRGRATGGGRRGSSREVRIVIQQAPVNPVSHPQAGLLNTLLRKTAPPAKRSKL